MQNINIFKLSESEISKAINIFSKAIPRHWPNTSEEARLWITDEFYHPDAIIFGAYIENNLAGVCSLLPMDAVLNKMEIKEAQIIKKAIEDTLRTRIRETGYIGGFATEEKYEYKGLSKYLFKHANAYAKNNELKFIIGHTARPTEKYPDLKMFDIAKSKFKMEELPTAEKIHYSSPADLEKVWFFKKTS